MAFRTLDNVDVAGKRVLLRADLNVPVRDGKITDLTRIERLSPTIRELAGKGAKVIVCSHFDRPEGQARAGDVAGPDGRGARARCWASACASPRTASARRRSRAVGALRERRRAGAGEHPLPRRARRRTILASPPRWPKLADLYVNDAFSAAHRAHASTEGVAHLLPAYAGRLMQAELEALDAALGHPRGRWRRSSAAQKSPPSWSCWATWSSKVDVLMIGGAMANTFLAAQGVAVGKSLQEARDARHRARHPGSGEDRPAARSCCRPTRWSPRELKANVPTQTVAIGAVPADAMILDVGPATVRRCSATAGRAEDAGVERPAGRLRNPAVRCGTTAIARAVAAATQAGALRSVAGGGDTVSALRHAGVLDKLSYVSTAGGAFLEWLEGKTLPGVAALEA